MKKPNILFLMCDQLQKEAFYNDPECLTPNFDKLRQRGVTFDNAYTPNAVCSPARASLMTGLLPHSHGVLCVTHTVDKDQAVLREENPHFAQSLVKNGYQTGYFGKWHVEHSEDPSRFGWNVNGAMRSDMYNKYYNEAIDIEKDKGNDKSQMLSCRRYNYPTGYNEETPLYGVTNYSKENRSTGIITKMANEFLDVQSTDKPWCCFVSTNDPHDPFICSKETYKLYDAKRISLPDNLDYSMEDKPNIYKKAGRVFADLTKDEHREARACYFANITEIDDLFGSIIDKVEAMGELENTVIILTTDHGELLGAHGLYCKNFSGYEEIYNIPLLMAGPNIAVNKTSLARVGLHDLCQTILDIAQCQSIDTVESNSFLCSLKDPETYDKQFTKGYAEYYGGRIWVTQRVMWDNEYKFIFNGFDFDELYNLKEDKLEMNNLIDDINHQHIVKKMCKYMFDKAKETNDHSLYNLNYPILRIAPFGPYES